MNYIYLLLFILSCSFFISGIVVCFTQNSFSKIKIDDTNTCTMTFDMTNNFSCINDVTVVPNKSKYSDKSDEPEIIKSFILEENLEFIEEEEII